MKKKILLKGPLLTRSGYGEQARFALRALRSKPDLFDVYIQPLRWGATSWLFEDNEEREWIDQAIEKTIGFIQQGGQFDISLQVTIPNEWEKLAPYNVGYTAGLEATRVPPVWIEKLNSMDKVITISSFSKDIFESSTYEGTHSETGQQVQLVPNTPISVVGYPVKTHSATPPLDLDLKYDFNFLSIAQFAVRKNIEQTIKWFMQEFRDDEVGLVLKTNLAKNCLMDREATLNKLKQLVSSLSDGAKCKLYLLHGDMTDEEIHSLYCHPKLKALIALPHGEGFGLPIFEAAYSGMPIVATGWSGQLDYLVDENKKEQFYNVSYDIQPIQEKAVWDGVLMKEAMWAYAKESSAKTQMRRCYEEVIENTGLAAKSCAYAEQLKERFSEEKMFSLFTEAVHRQDPEIDAWLAKLEAIEEL